MQQSIQFKQEIYTIKKFNKIQIQLNYIILYLLFAKLMSSILGRSIREFYASEQIQSQRNKKVGAKIVQDQNSIPQTYFQQPKSNWKYQKQRKKINGVINTCDYKYPQQVHSLISQQCPGYVHYNDGIFCFYSGNQIFFWTYKPYNYEEVDQFFHHICSNKITAVDFKRVKISMLQEKEAEIVMIAEGQSLNLFKIKTDELNRRKELKRIDVNFGSHQSEVITTIKILYQEHESGDIDLNRLSILFGGVLGKLRMYDIPTHKFYGFPGIKMSFGLGGMFQVNNTYEQFKKILVLKNFIFCLVEGKVLGLKYPIPFLNQRLRNSVYQRIDVYLIQSKSEIQASFWKKKFNIAKHPTGLKKYSSCTALQLWHKIQTTNFRFVQHFNNNQVELSQHLISMELKNNNVEILFKSGLRILINQNFGFHQKPSQMVKIPKSFRFGKVVQNSKTQFLGQSNLLLASAGTSFMVFDGFIASQKNNYNYYCPIHFNNNNNGSSSEIRQIQEEQNTNNRFPWYRNKYLIFTHSGFTVAELLYPGLSIFALITAYYQSDDITFMQKDLGQLSHRLEIIVNRSGDISSLIQLFQLFIQNQEVGELKINLRQDIYKVLMHQCMKNKDKDTISFTGAIENYRKNKSGTKNIELSYNAMTKEHLWGFFHKHSGQMVQIGNQYKSHKIMKIVLILQNIASKIFSSLKELSAKKCAYRRSEIVSIRRKANNFIAIIKKVMKDREQLKKIDVKLENKQMEKILPSFEINIEKIILLLQVFEHICELAFTGVDLINFSDLVLETSYEKRLLFSRTVVSLIQPSNEHYKNLVFNIQKLIPQLELEKTRLAEQLLSEERQKENQDKKYHPEITQISQKYDLPSLINELNYEQFRRILLPVPQFQRFEIVSNNPVAVGEKARYLKSYSNFMKAILSKIKKQKLEFEKIKQKQMINKGFFVHSAQNPSLNTSKKETEMAGSISYFTSKSQQLVNQLNYLYQSHIISPQQYVQAVSEFENLLSIQMRNYLQNFFRLKNIVLPHKSKGFQQLPGSFYHLPNQIINSSVERII